MRARRALGAALVAVALLAPALVVAVPALVSPASAALREDPETTVTGLPTPHIIPRPNSGHAPTEAGDRGGSLQLALLGLVCVALLVGTLHLVRVSKRARAARDADRAGDQDSRMALQASTPVRKPDR